VQTVSIKTQKSKNTQVIMYFKYYYYEKSCRQTAQTRTDHM